MLRGFPKIQVITDSFGFGYAYPTLTLTFIQIPALKPCPYLESRFNPGTKFSSIP
jgi:hypothetical protein